MKKIVSSDLKDSNTFAQEYKLVNKIKHDNVLRIYSIYRRKLDSTTYVLYILMEKAITDWDREIRAMASQKKYYSEGDLLIILKQCVEALSFLQQNKISHRDIKPQNICSLKMEFSIWPISAKPRKLKLANQIKNSIRLEVLSYI